MARLTEKQKKSIIIDYANCRNYSELARKYNVAVSTIQRFIQRDDGALKKAKEKKEENIQDILTALDERTDKLLIFYDIGIERLTQLAFETKDLKGLATSMAILIDKATLKKQFQIEESRINRGEKLILEEKTALIEAIKNSVGVWVKNDI